MTDQNPIENNPQENQPDNTAQGINLTPESVQMPEDNTVPLNPALSIEPLSASAAPSEENMQNTAGGIVLESAFEASGQPSMTQDFTSQNDISSDGISVSAVPHTDIPVLNPFDGMTGEDSQNTEMTGIAQPEESALTTDNSATAASSAPDAFADLYNISGTQPSDTQTASISPESEENISNAGQAQAQPEISAPSADAFADLYSDAGVSDSATATNNEQAAPAPEFQPAFEMPANTETDNTAAAEETSFPETFTPDHGFSFDGQESSINEAPTETMENTVAGIQPESEKSDNNTDAHEIPAIAPLTAETSQAEENNMEFLSAGIQETQPENTNQEPVLNEPQPEESVNSTENAVSAEEPVNESDNINADTVDTGISINMPEISSENAENITSDTVPENDNMAGETEPAADVSVNPVENTEEQNIVAETIPAQENAEPEPEPEVPAQETHESVPMPEQQEKEEKPAEPVAEVQPKTETKVSEAVVSAAAAAGIIASASSSKQEEKAAGNADTPKEESASTKEEKSSASSYIVPVIAILITAVFFFFLGKKSANLEHQLKSAQPVSIPAEENISSEEKPIDETSVENNEQQSEISAENTEGNSAIQEQEKSQYETQTGNSQEDLTENEWIKKTYTPEELDLLKQSYQEANQKIYIPANTPMLHFHVQNSHNIEVEEILASKAISPNEIANNQTALHIAIMMQSEEMCKILLAYGADANLSTEELPTPLTLAAALNNTDLVRLLLDNGSDPLLNFTNQGKTSNAYEIAKSKNNPEIIKMIEDKIKEKNNKK